MQKCFGYKVVIMKKNRKENESEVINLLGGSLWNQI